MCWAISRYVSLLSKSIKGQKLLLSMNSSLWKKGRRNFKRSVRMSCWKNGRCPWGGWSLRHVVHIYLYLKIAIFFFPVIMPVVFANWGQYKWTATLSETKRWEHYLPWWLHSQVLHLFLLKLARDLSKKKKKGRRKELGVSHKGWRNNLKLYFYKTNIVGEIRTLLTARVKFDQVDRNIKSSLVNKFIQHFSNYPETC